MWAVVVVAEYGVRNVAVRYYLNRAVIVAELLLGDDVRVVAMNVAVDADNVVHDT